MGIVQTSISRSRLPLRHIPNHITPDFFRSKFSDPSSCDWLDIDRLPFLDPMMPVFLAGKSQMHHLVGRYPIFSKIRGGALLTHTKSDTGSVPTRSVATAHSSPEMGRDIDPDLLHWIPPIIINDRFGREFNPVKNQLPQTVGHRRTEYNIDLGAGNLKFGLLSGSSHGRGERKKSAGKREVLHWGGTK